MKQVGQGFPLEVDSCKILWTVIDATTGKVGHLIREFNEEIKEDNSALVELSRWTHCLHDFGRNVLECIADSISFDACSEERAQFRSRMKDFIRDADKALDVQIGHSANEINEAESVRDQLQETVLLARQLHEDLKALSESLWHKLSEDSKTTLQNRDIIDLSPQDQDDVNN